MPENRAKEPPSLVRDLTAGVVVFLVAIPLCLGIALASGAPLMAGLISGIVAGIVVGAVSRSHTSVSGPAAGLTAIVASQIDSLGSFEAFLLVVVLAGAVQIAFGAARAGFIAAFFPSSVVKGLLGAIGAILILKQIPHLLGHDKDPEGDFSFWQRDHENTLTELAKIVDDFHLGAAAIGLSALALIVLWENWAPLKRTKIPAPLAAVVWGVGLSLALVRFGADWAVPAEHLVNVPILSDMDSWRVATKSPDWSQWLKPSIHIAAVTLALVASLETLLNIEAVDKLDPRQRVTPSSRELVAQGIGNVLSGLLGGLPMTSVIVRGSANIDAGAESRRSAIFHGVLLAVFALGFPRLVNMIPLSCLAAILFATGYKLVSPKVWSKMWRDGPTQFVPFALTVFAIVFTDLLIGVGVGLAMSLTFILASNYRRPMKTSIERHLGGDVVHVELANQVSFLNRAALEKTLNEVPVGGHVLLDAANTVYIDPDVYALIREYREKKGPARGVSVSLRGFREQQDDVQYVDYSTKELQQSLTAERIVEILKEGNARFRGGQRLTRDLRRMINATAEGQYPLAVILSCIDSRTPTEYIFDLGLGDIFNIRIAGNVVSPGVLASVEYACAVVGVKLVVVMGHTRCGAVTAAVDFANCQESVETVTGCQHLHVVLDSVRNAIPDQAYPTPEDRQRYDDDVARRNVAQSVANIHNQSRTIGRLAGQGKVAVVGAMYDVGRGDVAFLADENGPVADAVEPLATDSAKTS